MAAVTVTICNKRGLHARAAAKFVKTAESFASDIHVSKIQAAGQKAESVSGRSILGLMMLGADIGSDIHVTADGEDAERAIEAIAQLVERRFDEDE